jgi:hypothetical protein
MQRELKFRAWDKDNETMIYPESKNNETSLSYTINAWCDSESDASIIMQYIGLKDKTRTKEFPEGKEIYEDDICKYNGVLCTVVFNNGAFMVRCGTIVNEFVYIWDAEQLEIIGNKHENSELL